MFVPFLLGLLATLSAAESDYDPEVLDQVAARVEQVARSGGKPVVIFDLDDTLINTRERNVRIVADLIAQPEVRARFPYEAGALTGLGAEEVRYLLKDTLAAKGVEDPAFVSLATEFWLSKFFTSEYCVADHPNPGAVEYVTALASRGATVVYLTGRDGPRMGEGTARNLAALGFPGGSDGALLVMKPTPDGDDLRFRISQFGAIAGLGLVVAAFENEPANINAFQEGFPDATMVFLDTIHSPKPDSPKPGVFWVADFHPTLWY